MSKQQAHWTTLGLDSLNVDPSYLSTDKLVATSNNTFAKWSGSGFMEYNIINDKWTTTLQCSDDKTNLFYYDSAYDFNKKHKIWYLYNSEANKHQFITVNSTSNNWQFYDVEYFGRYVKCIILNNKCHIIGGEHNNKHLIWNNNTKQFEQIYEFSEYKKGYYLSQDIAFIKSKNMLLLFGGTDENNAKKLGVIYKYNVMEQKWNKLSVQMPKPFRVNFGVTSIMNGRFVLLFGGWFENNTSTDKILIYNVLTQTFTESKIRCPISGVFKAITIHDDKKDELTVFGYVRKQWNLLKISFDMFPPFYLVKLMKCWYWTGCTHLIEINWGKHWKIDTLQLL